MLYSWRRRRRLLLLPLQRVSHWVKGAVVANSYKEGTMPIHHLNSLESEEERENCLCFHHHRQHRKGKKSLLFNPYLNREQKRWIHKAHNNKKKRAGRLNNSTRRHCRRATQQQLLIGVPFSHHRSFHPESSISCTIKQSEKELRIPFSFLYIFQMDFLRLS